MKDILIRLGCCFLFVYPGACAQSLKSREGGLRVPFAARWPGKITPGTTSDHPSAFWDFLPTACDIAGIKPSTPIDGISYLPALTGDDKAQQSHDYFYWEVNENAGPAQVVLKDGFKGIRMYEKSFELYNIKSDPRETQNIAAQHPGIVQSLKDLMDTSRTAHPEFPLTKRKPHYRN